MYPKPIDLQTPIRTALNVVRVIGVAGLASLLLATTAAAYNGCDKYRFGSQDWWFCISDKDGER